VSTTEIIEGYKL